MCEPFNRDNESRIGEIRALCPTARDCLLADLGQDKHGSLRYDGSPAKRVLKAFLSIARTLVVENFYFDMDYRSEYAATREVSFAAKSSLTTRWHFFRCDISKKEHLQDWVEKAENGDYLGYVIIRPQIPGTIGRSIITPYGNHTGLMEEVSLDQRVRTVVSEHVTLFGIPLVATGVPFMEQDGHLLRCAHISAWLCHYSAVLKGIATRQPSAVMYSKSEQLEVLGRPYPSKGLTLLGLSGLLDSLNLPPETLMRGDLVEGRPPTWADRSEFFQNLANQEKKEDRDRIWIKDNLSRSIRRYLNSGFPSIVCYPGHTKVVVGYARQKDLTGYVRPDPDSDTRSDIAAFIVSDDTVGPFEILMIDTLVDNLSRPYGTSAVLIPLPEAVWLSGDAAERAAIHWFTELGASRLSAIDKWLPNRSRERARLEKTLSNFVSGTRTIGAESSEFPEVYTVRSYVIDNSDLKFSVRQRFRDRRFIRELGQLQLPKYVWITEVLDRKLRRRGKADVVATLGMDATTVTGEVPNPRLIRPLFGQIPGQAFTFQLSGDDVVPGSAVTKPSNKPAQSPTSDGRNWFVAQRTPYFSGRWGHPYDTDNYPKSFLSPERTLSRSKAF
jgi:hypothetical protein